VLPTWSELIRVTNKKFARTAELLTLLGCWLLLLAVTILPHHGADRKNKDAHKAEHNMPLLRQLNPIPESL